MLQCIFCHLCHLPTSGTNLTLTVTQLKIVQIHCILKSRLIPACSFQICTYNLHINITFVDIRCRIFNWLINKLINYHLIECREFSIFQYFNPHHCFRLINLSINDIFNASVVMGYEHFCELV